MYFCAPSWLGGGKDGYWDGEREYRDTGGGRGQGGRRECLCQRFQQDTNTYNIPGKQFSLACIFVLLPGLGGGKHGYWDGEREYRETGGGGRGQGARREGVPLSAVSAAYEHLQYTRHTVLARCTARVVSGVAGCCPHKTN